MALYRKPEGFSGEISYVLPQSIWQRSARNPLVQPLYVTDIGYYPHADYHYRNRPNGAHENILILCVEGGGWIELPERSYELHPDEAIIVPQGVAHTYGASEQQPWTIYWAHFAGNTAEYFLSQLESGRLTFPVSARSRQSTISLFRGVFETLRRGYTLANIITMSLTFSDVLGTLLFANDAFHPNLESETNRKIDRTIEFMLQNIGSRLSVGQLAEVAHLSLTHYSQLFRQKTGYPPIEFFIRLKVQHACQLLDRTDMKVYEVANALGYEDQYYFSRLFHKIMGIAPREYQARDVSWRHMQASL